MTVLFGWAGVAYLGAKLHMIWPAIDPWRWLIVPTTILFLGILGKWIVIGMKWQALLFGLELTTAAAADIIANVLGITHKQPDGKIDAAFFWYFLLAGAVYLIILATHKSWEPRLQNGQNKKTCFLMLVVICNALGFLTLASFMRYII